MHLKDSIVIAAFIVNQWMMVTPCSDFQIDSYFKVWFKELDLVGMFIEVE